jgi:hypothetical protein
MAKLNSVAPYLLKIACQALFWCSTAPQRGSAVNPKTGRFLPVKPIILQANGCQR